MKVSVIAGSELYFKLQDLLGILPTVGEPDCDLHQDGEVIVLNGEIFFDPIEQREIVGMDDHGEYDYANQTPTPY